MAIFIFSHFDLVCLVAVAMAIGKLYILARYLGMPIILLATCIFILDPRSRANSECMANNNRMCAANQICVERKSMSNSTTLNMCIDSRLLLPVIN